VKVRGYARKRSCICSRVVECASSLDLDRQQLWGTSSEFYFRIDELLRELANPNLHDIPMRLPFRVELWDRHDQHIRWAIAAASSVAVGHGAKKQGKEVVKLADGLTSVASVETESFINRPSAEVF